MLALSEHDLQFSVGHVCALLLQSSINSNPLKTYAGVMLVGTIARFCILVILLGKNSEYC